jgi:DNA-binding response OmpR family regulator
MPKQVPKILIVDDDPVISAIYRRRFQASGFEVALAANTTIGASALHAFQPDILLLDLNMPGESGLDFLAKLRAVPKYRNLPVVIVTAEAEESPQLLAASSSPATGVMRKGEWNPDAVFTAVEWALQQRQRRAARTQREAEAWPVTSRV